MLGWLKGLLAFFTRYPVKGDLDEAASHLYALPLISLFISAVAAAVGFSLSLALAPAVQAVALAVIYLQTGALHLDGLADFFDGLYAKGDAEKRRAVLKDPHIGAAGASALFIVLFIEFISILNSGSGFLPLLKVLLSADVSAKFSMTLMLQGKRFNEGIGKYFSERTRPIHAAAFALISLLFYPLTGVSILASLAVGALVSIIIYRAAVSAFGGASGDPLGAASEISRAVTVFLICSRF